MVRNLLEHLLRKGSAGLDYDPDHYWEQAAPSYEMMPSVRHRRRFILKSLEKIPLSPSSFIFDYGCGIGNVLLSIRDKFHLTDEQLGGCDISERALAAARERLPTAHLHSELFPHLAQPCDVVICTEVIEHTPDYQRILSWIHQRMAPGGCLLLTTQTGPIHASDRYTGHTQHFAIDQLNDCLRTIGFSLEHSAQWGFPLFSLQKYLTDVNWDWVRKDFVEGPPSARRKAVFDLGYAAFRLQDWIHFGPQIYIIATKS